MMNNRLCNGSKAQGGRLLLLDFVFDNDAQAVLFFDED